MGGVLAAPFAILLHLQPVGVGPPVFRRRVVPPLARRARQGDDLARHGVFTPRPRSRRRPRLPRRGARPPFETALIAARAPGLCHARAPAPISVTGKAPARTRTSVSAGFIMGFSASYEWKMRGGGAFLLVHEGLAEDSGSMVVSCGARSPVMPRNLLTEHEFTDRLCDRIF